MTAQKNKKNDKTEEKKKKENMKMGKSRLGRKGGGITHWYTTKYTS